jgi:glycosyltransferase involved in cell wall biosynthesis
LTTTPHVLLVCSGLDHAHRGYESFARECFEQLSGEPGVRIELVKGSGPRAGNERAIPTFRRDRAVARSLGRLIGFRPFRLEALAFAFSLMPLLLSRQPDVVYMSEWDTARGLAELRSRCRLRSRLLLCNGGFAETGFDHLDRVQQLTPEALNHVVARGADPARHSVLPLGFDIPREFIALGPADRATLRTKWQLPPDRQIVISVAALNRTHKRLDYLIDEVAAVPGPRPFLLLVGEPDRETPELRADAAARLGPENHRFLTVAANEVPDLLRASDTLVLASLAEMQGRAVVEAMSHGVQCLVHLSPVMRFAVGDYGLMADFAQPGALAGLLSQGLRAAHEPAMAAQRHHHVYERFSWDSLRPSYVRLLSDVARGEAANRMVSSSYGEKLST